MWISLIIYIIPQNQKNSQGKKRLMFSSLNKLLNIKLPKIGHFNFPLTKTLNKIDKFI